MPLSSSSYIVRTLNPMHPFIIDPTDRAQEMSKNLSNLTEAEVAECLQELAECSEPC